MKPLPIRFAAAGLLLSLLACRPVIAIGWSELFIIFVIVAFLLGPFLLKVVRAWDAYQKSQKKK